MISSAQYSSDGFKHRIILVHEKDATFAARKGSAARNEILRLRHWLKGQFNRKARATLWHIAHADRASVFGHNAITNAQTKASALANGFCRVKRIENARSVLHACATICNLHKKLVAFGPSAYPKVSVGGTFEDG